MKKSNYFIFWRHRRSGGYFRSPSMSGWKPVGVGVPLTDRRCASWTAWFKARLCVRHRKGPQSWREGRIPRQLGRNISCHSPLQSGRNDVGVWCAPGLSFCLRRWSLRFPSYLKSWQAEKGSPFWRERDSFGETNVEGIILGRIQFEANSRVFLTVRARWAAEGSLHKSYVIQFVRVSRSNPSQGVRAQ